jgi:adenylate cyclase
MERHREGIGEVLAQLISSEPFETELGGQQVFAFISPLGIGEPAFFVASVPKEYELNILYLLQRNIYLTAAISLAITVLLALVLGRTLSRPILRLVEGMNVVRSGDLSVQVEATTRDEVGLLTDAFNQMLVGLRERLQLMKYVGSHTRDMISKASGSAVSLGGSRQELAVLFTDIRGFTAFSEKRSPEEVIDKVNRYLGFQAALVPAFEGSIDKFVGDEMVALFFGDRAVERAIRCSLEIQRRVKEEHKTDPVPIDIDIGIGIGIGINYGPVILGNMGAENRLDYTVIGSEVNLGARLCAAAAGGEILIRRELIEASEVPFEIATVKKMSFKGVSQELEIAALAGDVT